VRDVQAHERVIARINQVGPMTQLDFLPPP
jgi:hypothetical protein